MIDRFRAEYDFLSNFYPAEMVYDGICYQNAEAAFQAQKCADRAERFKFSKLTPMSCTLDTTINETFWASLGLQLLFSGRIL